MPNPVKGEVSLSLSDGRVFTVVLDMEALVEAEGAYGKPLQQMMADAGAGFVGASRALLYGALRAKHSDVTLRDASAIFMTDGEAVSQALTTAAETAFPDIKNGAGDKETGNARQAGGNSGGSGAKRVSTRIASGDRPPEPSP